MLGELACVVGPNGAGKSTLINAIAGLNRICAGTLRFDGADLRNGRAVSWDVTNAAMRARDIEGAKRYLRERVGA